MHRTSMDTRGFRAKSRPASRGGKIQGLAIGRQGCVPRVAGREGQRSPSKRGDLGAHGVERCALKDCVKGGCPPGHVRGGTRAMDRSKLALSFLAALSAVGVAGERRASACGGCFHPPTQTVTDITDERMLLSVSAGQSTLYDQIQYSGSPSSFAWVLPIHGTVTVGLSADVLFDSIDAVTATQIQPPPKNCPT